jgi:RsiW-degrading membrane proteinase PrsW (M82 family)
VLATLRWLFPTALPAVIFAVLAVRTDPRREPRWLVAATFFLGAGLGLVALFFISRASTLTGLDMRVASVGERGAMIFIFFVMAPIQEAAKAAAAWPALLSKHIDEPYDGVVYAAAASLGFAAIESGFTLHAHPSGGIWVARALLALPSHVFFSCFWGYALGRARHGKSGAPIFPAAFLAAIVARGLYSYFVYGRGPGALLGVSPLLAAMGAATWVLWRDLRARQKRSVSIAPPSSRRWARFSAVTHPPSLSAVRAALRRADEPVKIRWVLLGALVTIGAMLAGLASGVVAARLLHIDLSTVDEHDVGAAAPALLLGAGLLASFPTSGWLIARAAGVHTLLEPALAAVVALFVTLVALGFAAPFAVVFGLALAPIAWLLSIAGAWVGRSA